MSNNSVITAMLTLLISMSAYAERQSAIIPSSDISGTKVFTDIHSTDSIRNTVIIYTTKIPNCARGAWFTQHNNEAIFSTLLASIISNRTAIELAVEDTKPTPWGDSNFCGLLSLQLLN